MTSYTLFGLVVLAVCSYSLIEPTSAGRPEPTSRSDPPIYAMSESIRPPRINMEGQMTLSMDQVDNPILPNYPYSSSQGYGYPYSGQSYGYPYNGQGYPYNGQPFYPNYRFPPFLPTIGGPLSYPYSPYGSSFPYQSGPGSYPYGSGSYPYGSGSFPYGSGSSNYGPPSNNDAKARP